MAADVHALLEHNKCLLIYPLMEGRKEGGREKRKEGRGKQRGRKKDFLF